MSKPTRRRFLQAGLAAAGGLAAARGTALAIEPIRRNGGSRLRLSLAAYSMRQYLELRRQPRPTMSLDDFVDFAAGQPLDAVELTAYYFPETTRAYLANLKGHCTRLGLDVSGTAVGNSFCTPNAERLRTQIADVKRWIEHTSLLGGKTMRIFAGNVERGDTEDRARARCVGAIQEVCDHAGQFGIYLALENHGGITGNIDQMLALVREVRHNWFGVNLDTGNFHSADPYADLARLAPYAVVVQIKTEIHRTGRPQEEADLRRLTDILRAANFRGYIALEYEGSEEPRTAIPRHLATLRQLMG
jgi:sugar phosphate isomerase/epimerase